MSECYFEVYIGKRASASDVFDVCNKFEKSYDNVEYYLNEGYFRVSPVGDEE